MSSVDIKELFEAGAHFGHKTSRWHPKMAPYIHSVKGDQHIINLDRTVELLAEAQKALEDIAAAGKQVLFVGTKRQARQTVQRAAEATGMPYVNVRWMGGMLTNHKTMNDRIKHLKKLEERMLSGELKNRYNKLEVQRFQEEIDALNHNFGGIKNLHGAPGAVVIVDVMTESIAMKEAQKLSIPVVAIVDTNADPRGVTYPVPANDDSIKAVDIIVGHLANAVNDGKGRVKKEAAKPDGTVRAVPGAVAGAEKGPEVAAKNQHDSNKNRVAQAPKKPVAKKVSTQKKTEKPTKIAEKKDKKPSPAKASEDKEDKK